MSMRPVVTPVTWLSRLYAASAMVMAAASDSASGRGPPSVWPVSAS